MGGKGWHRAGWKQDMDAVGHSSWGTQRRRLAGAGGEEPCPFVGNMLPLVPKKPNITAAFAAVQTSSMSRLTRHHKFRQDDKVSVFWRCVMATVKSSRGFRVSLPAAALGTAMWEFPEARHGGGMLIRRGVQRDTGLTEGQKGPTTAGWFQLWGFGGVCSWGRDQSVQAVPADLARQRKGQSKISTRVARQRIWVKKQQVSAGAELLRAKAEKIWGVQPKTGDHKGPKKAYVLLKHSRRGIPWAGSTAAKPNPGENGFGKDGATASCHFGESHRTDRGDQFYLWSKSGWYRA